MLAIGRVEGGVITGILVRTFAYTVDAYAVDHWAAEQPGFGGPGYAGGSDRARHATYALMEQMRRAGPGTILVRYDRSQRVGEFIAAWKIPWGLTRAVVKTYDGAVVAVAFKGYIEDAVARRLADVIANALWRDRYRVQHRPSPLDIDGLGTPLPTWSSVGHLLSRTR